MKKIMTVVGLCLFAIVANLAAIWVFNQMDAAWECRAKAAGYYDTMPDSFKAAK